MSAGSKDNLKAEIVIKALYEYNLLDFKEYEIDIHRIDIFNWQSVNPPVKYIKRKWISIVFTDIILDHQIRVKVENQKLVELYIDEENEEKTVGNIYRGIVKRILPGIQAAFIDIGKNKNAYLSLKENNIADENGNKLKQGDHITVQIQKESMGTKGYKVTRNISIAGKYTVMMPGEKSIGISRKINDENERLRLKKLYKNLNVNNYGIIFRTDSSGKNEEELI